jgi:hypothetical protein
VAYRKFTDADGMQWEVRDRSHSEWELEPVGLNRGQPRTVPAPGYEKDPFEMSEAELQALLGKSSGGPARNKKSPFAD